MEVLPHFLCRASLTFRSSLFRFIAALNVRRLSQNTGSLIQVHIKNRSLKEPDADRLRSRFFCAHLRVQSARPLDDQNVHE